ncbi:hypothetical protein CRM22_002116 [Opisthorchis felineus]|uniref:TM2 domain-containing protein n=1 Tax=Opisthorchis felineus TaxID=147828 RepID=A0A4S2M7I4_OPIFE|nr:hypothetical protein CRM22_002116 [Opisthorchis felineus]
MVALSLCYAVYACFSKADGVILSFLLLANLVSSSNGQNCSALQPGQYRCDLPLIDKATQQPIDCSRETLQAPVACRPAPGIFCNGQYFTGEEVGFLGSVTCRFVTGYRFDTALLLSVFGGLFGLDLFYLGYVALGLLKLGTIGGFGLWYLADILLIAIGIVGPADGSTLLTPYYDPPVTLLSRSPLTVYIG